jgi:putative transposase
MMYPLVRDLAADKIPVAVTCRVLGFSKQAFYAWCMNPVSRRDWDDAHLINAAIDIHHDDPEFGYRFITDELVDHGIKASRNRVNRLCSSQRLWSVHARKRGLSRKPGPPVHDDLVLRDFTAPAPNLLWLTDITEHPTAEGKLYLCAVKDACSRRIVGYSIDSRMTSDLAVNALRNALALRGGVATIVHSDRGSQFRSHAYVRALRQAQLRGSMGRVGACADKPRWSPSSACCRRTSSTGSAGRHANNSGWRSSSGSRRPTTADGAKTPSDASHLSNSRHSPTPLTRHDRPYPTRVNRSLGSPPATHRLVSAAVKRISDDHADPSSRRVGHLRACVPHRSTRPTQSAGSARSARDHWPPNRRRALALHCSGGRAYGVTAAS